MRTGILLTFGDGVKGQGQLWHSLYKTLWAVFSAPEPTAQVHYQVVIIPCPSVVNFHINYFSSETAEQNSTKLDRKQDLKVLYQVCVFRADRKNKIATPSSDWLSHFLLLLWNRWTEFNKTWREVRSRGPLPNGRPGLWFAETFLASPLKSLKGILWNLTGSKIFTSATKFVFFRLIGKPRWPPWPLIGWDTLITTLDYIVAQQAKTHWLINI